MATAESTTVKRTIYSRDFKVQACKLYLSSNRSLEEVAQELHINTSLFAKWVSAFRKHGENGFLTNGRKGLKWDTTNPVLGPILSRADQVFPESQLEDKVLRDQLTRLKLMYAEAALEQQALRELLKKTNPPSPSGSHHSRNAATRVSSEDPFEGGFVESSGVLLVLEKIQEHMHIHRSGKER